MNRQIDSIRNVLVEYFSLGQYLVPQAEAEQAIREGVSFRGTNIIILIVAILIASLGLNTNSTAVIIGAMLISPLMGPIIGIGLGVGIHDFNLIKMCLRSLLMAAGFSILASTLYFLISPVSEGHSELLARTSPTIYDVLIGFFGGAAGIIGIGSRSKGNVIPGVAIATALMPPLCTAGYGLATWQLNYFFGATYLFLINSVYIALATFIGVKLMKYKGTSAVDEKRAAKVRKTVYTIALIVMIPSVFLTWDMLRQNNFSRRANEFVADECHFPSTQVLTTRATMTGGEKQLDITLIGKLLPTDSLKMALESRLKFYGLQGTQINIIQGDAGSMDERGVSMQASVKDVYQLAQTTIERQQTTIDSLRAVLQIAEMRDTIGASLAPEIKIVFPQVKDIAVTRAVFSATGTAKLDTANIALVNYSRAMGAAESERFKKYLEARLQMKNIRIVNIAN